jgi:5'-3' exonuclease
MGVSGQDNLSWQTGHLPLNIVVFLLEQIRSTVNPTNAPPANELVPRLEQQRDRLKLGIDASLVGFKYVHDKSSLLPDRAIQIIGTALSRLLIDVVILLDGKERHPSKRATCKRKGDAERDSIQLLVARSSLQSLLDDGENSAEGAKKVHDLQKKIRGLENSLKRKLPSNFDQNLQDFVDGYKPEGKGIISIETAPFQADPCLAQLAVAGDIDAIISGDSDFCVYVGPNGQSGLGDIMLKDFQIIKADESIKGCKLYTGQKSVADLIEAILTPKLGHSPFDKRDKNFSGRTPGYPAFSGVDDPMVRALIALLVGCDACPGGVSQKGPKVAFNLLKKHSNLSGEALHDKLAAEISSMKGAVVKDKAAVLCLAKSFLYETTNHVLCQSWCCSSALLLDLWLASRDRTQ